MALYCMGVMCSKPGGGTSQYFFTFFFFSRWGERLQVTRKIYICYISFINISLCKIPIFFFNYFFHQLFQDCQHVGKNNSTAIKPHYSHSAWCLWVFAIEKVGRWGAVVATMHTLACVGLLYYLPALSGGKLVGELKWHWKGFTFLSHEPWHWATVPLHN